MTDAEKMLIEEMRITRKESNDNFVLLHRKVDAIKDDHQEQITDNAKDIASFKAKWGVITFVLIAIGNLLKPMYELIKSKIGV